MKLYVVLSKQSVEATDIIIITIIIIIIIINQLITQSDAPLFSIGNHELSSIPSPVAESASTS